MKKNNTQILELLINRTVQYIKEDLLVDISHTPISIKEVNQIEYNDISTFISLSGDLSGTIGLSVSNHLAKIFIQNSVFGDIDEMASEELASENVAEMLNITLGNIIKDLDIVKQGGKVDISTPYTLHNSVTISKKKNGKMYLNQTKCLDEMIITSYFI